MMAASAFESIGVLLAVLTPLVGIPLTLITFYLRSLREHQVSWHDELVRRVELLEGALVDLRKTLTEFERDFTGKEEWLRECMHTRRVLERLIEATVRIETTVRSLAPHGEKTRRFGSADRGETSGTCFRSEGSGDLEEGSN